MTGRLPELGWALVRFTFGVLLALLHGAAKIFTPGMMDKFAQGVGAMGFPQPTFFAWAAALAEFAGGLLVAVGLFTRPAAAFAGFTMLVALYRHRVDPVANMEPALMFGVVMLAVLLIGPGRYSLDARFRGTGAPRSVFR